MDPPTWVQLIVAVPVAPAEAKILVEVEEPNRLTPVPELKSVCSVWEAGGVLVEELAWA